MRQLDSIRWLYSMRQLDSIRWLYSMRQLDSMRQLGLTDSINLLQKAESGMGCPDWHTAMQSSATKTSVDLLSWARRSQWE